MKQPPDLGRTGVVALAAATCFLLACSAVASADDPPLKRVQTIPLKGPAGRLDHLALDAKHGRLFVANMANSSLDVVDLTAGRLVKQIPGQHKIQGIAYAADLDRIFVGNGEDGVCNVFDGRDYKLLKAVKLDDADNVRYDARTHRVYVTHADKALAVLDGETLETLADVHLPAAPEAFQLAKSHRRLYLNTPSPSQVVAIDADRNTVIGRFPLTQAGQNFPLALDEANRRIFAGCRKKPMIVVLDMDTGKEVAGIPIPGDTDDLFYDARHKRLYASCGEGSLAVIRQVGADRYEVEARLPTVRVARTCLLDADTGHLYLVVPRREGSEGPEVWVYEVQP
jgi:DNA-binding beta-propeller fold protein YncE